MKIQFKKPDIEKMKDTYNNKIKTSYNDYVDHLQNGGKPLVWTVIITFLVMVIVCLAVFFASVKGAEKVMVPNVVGKDLETDRKSTRLNSSHQIISYAVFCLKKKN